MEKLQDETHLHMLNGESNMNHILNHGINDLRSAIFGIFYRLSLGTIVVNKFGSKNQKPSLIGKIKQFLPLLVGLPILVRAIFMIGRLSDTTLLTQNWGITFAVFATSMHGLASIVILFIWNMHDVFGEFLRRLKMFVATTKDKKIDHKAYKKAQFLAFIFLIFYMYAFVYFSIENYLFYEHVTQNTTASYREPLTGSIDLWAIDALIIAWTAFVSGITLVLYMLINHALSTETQKFNAELKQAAETGQLQHADLFNNYSNRHLQLISTVKFANEKLSMLATPNLMLFVICHFANVFTMRSFGDHFDLHQKILCINFLLASLFALLITIKKPAAVNNEINETKNLVLLEQSIWKDADSKLNNVARSIVDRIRKADIYTVIFDGFVINERIFHVIFMLFAVIVEILACWKKTQ